MSRCPYQLPSSQNGYIQTRSVGGAVKAMQLTRPGGGITFTEIARRLLTGV